MRRSLTAGLVVAALTAGIRLGRLSSPRQSPSEPWHHALRSLAHDPATTGLREQALEALDRSDDPTALAEALEVLGFVGRPGDEELLAAVARSRDPELGPYAIEALGRMGTDEAVAVLVTRLDDPDTGFRAAWALGRSRHPSAAGVLLGLLDDPLRQSWAVPALGVLGEPAAIDALWRTLERGSPESAGPAARALAVRASYDPAVADRAAAVVEGPRTASRSTLITGLARSRDPLAREALIADLASAPAPIAARAATTLGQMQDPAAIPALRRAAANGGRAVRTAAIASLGAIHAPSAVRALLELAGSGDPALAVPAIRALPDPSDPETVERLVAIADHGPPSVRVAVRARLFGWPWKEVPDPVLQEARRSLSDPSSSASVDAIPLLVAHGDADDWAALEALPDAGGTRRYALTRALVASSRPEAEALLVRLASHADPGVGREALTALVDRGRLAEVEEIALAQLARSADQGTEGLLMELGTPRLVAAIQERAASGTFRERAGAMRALVSEGTREQIQEVVDLADGDPALRREVINWVLANDAIDLQGWARRCEEDPDPSVRLLGVRALERVGTPDASVRLLELTGSDEANIRVAALDALSRVGGPDAVVALSEGLQEKDLRWTALYGLQRSGTPEARKVLREVADGNGVETELRTQVIGAIHWSDEPDGAEFLARTLRDDDPSVRISALSALEAVGTTAAAEMVVGFLRRTDDPDDRQAAAAVLSSMGGTVAEDHRAEIEAARQPR